MDRYIIKQLIKEKSTNKIFAYELLFETNDDNLYNSDVSAADAVINFLLQNNNIIFDDRRTFITLTPTLLFRNTPKMFNSKDVVIQIGMSVLVHPLSENFIKRYHDNGYSFAIDDFRFSPKCFGLLDYVDYVKINPYSFVGAKQEESIVNIIEMAHGFGKKVIATNINTYEDYLLAQKLDFDFIQGSYIGENLGKKQKKVDYMQSNFFRLVVEVSQEEPDIDKIEEIIKMDAGLSFAILKLANSINFGLKHKTSSIRQSIVTIGIRALKQWVYLLTFIDEEGDVDPESEELLKLSFLRASFAQELERFIDGFELTGPECYIMGMFSTLGYLTDAPVEEVLNEINIEDTIFNAITKFEGDAGKLLSLVIHYEKGEWKEVKQLAEDLGLSSSIIAQCYMNCVDEVNTIWKNLTSNMPDTKEIEDIKSEAEEKAKNEAKAAAKAPAKKTAKKTTKKAEEEAEEAAEEEEEKPKKKAAAKKTTAKKTTTKKAATKKSETTPKKTAEKKTTAKSTSKTTPKKTAEKKTTAKTTAKKTTTKKTTKKAEEASEE